MFNIDISDSSIEALKLKKGLLGKFSVSSFGRVELEEGIVRNTEILDPQKLAEKLGGLVKGQKINFTLPDLRTFTCRILLPLDISRSAIESFLKDKAAEVIPYDFEDLVYDFKVVNETEKGREILFIAVSKKILIDCLKTFAICKFSPLVAVPESLAAFEIFKETIVKNEIVLYVDIGGKTSTLSFFDKFGPFLTLNKAVETKVLEKEIKKASSFLKEKYSKEVKRVVIGGGGSLEVDGDSFSKEIGIWTTKADKILSDKLAKIDLNFNADKTSPVLFLNVLGLSLLSQRKDELNLVKDIKTLLLELEKEESKEKNVEDKEKGKKEETEEGEEREDEGKEKQVEEGEVDGKEGQEESGEKSHSNFFQILLKFKRVLVIIIVALLTFFGIYFLVKKPFVKKAEEQTPVISPTIQPATPTATPSAKLERKDFKIKVLNGSGIAGKAGEAASSLEELGYEVTATGNADSFDYEETVIKIKEEKKDFLSLLTNDLETFYTVSSEENVLVEDEEADAVVIVGKE